MKKRILDYRRGMDALLSGGGAHDWQALRIEHLAQIAFFQHERLIHLLVTLAFALFELLAAALAALLPGPGTLALAAALLVLLVPYVRHYYLLENETQRLYAQYDRIAARCGETVFAGRDGA